MGDLLGVFIDCAFFEGDTFASDFPRVAWGLIELWVSFKLNGEVGVSDFLPVESTLRLLVSWVLAGEVLTGLLNPVFFSGLAFAFCSSGRALKDLKSRRGSGFGRLKSEVVPLRSRFLEVRKAP